ncbi:uncharacterized protein G2W53_016089 [Senna tora]|uniref:Uncharacterized protein n=1 Tax=Senna tora TaxID=362788 RepID=A0A835C6J6_9FABA|nr:uncharacterized protein G2W53_016089 [Senna tora]
MDIIFGPKHSDICKLQLARAKRNPNMNPISKWAQAANAHIAATRQIHSLT